MRYNKIIGSVAQSFPLELYCLALVGTTTYEVLFVGSLRFIKL